MQIVLLVFVGVVTGAMVALQNVINASLGRYAGSIGAVFVVAVISALLMFVLILLFPRLRPSRVYPVQVNGTFTSAGCSGSSSWRHPSFSFRESVQQQPSLRS